jgi:hypothetical protein
LTKAEASLQGFPAELKSERYPVEKQGALEIDNRGRPDQSEPRILVVRVNDIPQNQRPSRIDAHGVNSV